MKASWVLAKMPLLECWEDALKARLSHGIRQRQRLTHPVPRCSLETQSSSAFAGRHCPLRLNSNISLNSVNNTFPGLRGLDQNRISLIFPVSLTDYIRKNDYWKIRAFFFFFLDVHRHLYFAFKSSNWVTSSTPKWQESCSEERMKSPWSI